ncbi:MAG: hypothetical protein IIB44_00980 [Candidatus Marinimicrobia bacterium]|nr:hypothetical protein [Candidatus Neomarinimicrobiota bacterium]
MYKIKIMFFNLVLLGIVLSQVNVDPVKVLLSKNRDILAAEEAYKAALKNIKVYGVLPDPMVESTFFIEPIETRNGPMKGQFMLCQKFPLWRTTFTCTEINLKHGILVTWLEALSILKMRNLNPIFEC